jgi:adenylate kinase
MVAPVHGPRLVILGRQGSGKGTQGTRLASHLGIEHLSTGAILRDAVERATPLGRRVVRYLNQGRLVPDELMLGVIESALRDPEVQRRGFLLDGFPRTRRQAAALLDLLGTAPLDAALLLDVPLDMVRCRLSARRVCRRCETPTVAMAHEDTVACRACGGVAMRRSDDTPEAIDRRLAAYEAEAAPLEQLFHDRGLLVNVDAVGDPDDVFERILVALRPTLWGTGEAVG